MEVLNEDQVSAAQVESQASGAGWEENDSQVGVGVQGGEQQPPAGLEAGGQGGHQAVRIQEGDAADGVDQVVGGGFLQVLDGVGAHQAQAGGVGVAGKGDIAQIAADLSATGRLPGERPVQAPFVLLEEAELLR
ncbi:hypothetical protein AB0E66_27165 [Streptomyces sp. NPDC033753]|uniref:hypothetical protein n=1 Tax=Streptomyces sp. NPDC033753 TaxID=3155128 RepID=UPI0033EA2239